MTHCFFRLRSVNHLIRTTLLKDEKITGFHSRLNFDKLPKEWTLTNRLQFFMNVLLNFLVYQEVCIGVNR